MALRAQSPADAFDEEDDTTAKTPVDSGGDASEDDGSTEGLVPASPKALPFTARGPAYDSRLPKNPDDGASGFSIVPNSGVDAMRGIATQQPYEINQRYNRAVAQVQMQKTLEDQSQAKQAAVLDKQSAKQQSIAADQAAINTSRNTGQRVSRNASGRLELEKDETGKPIFMPVVSRPDGLWRGRKRLGTADELVNHADPEVAAAAAQTKNAQDEKTFHAANTNFLAQVEAAKASVGDIQTQVNDLDAANQADFAKLQALNTRRNDTSWGFQTDDAKAAQGDYDKIKADIDTRNKQSAALTNTDLPAATNNAKKLEVSHKEWQSSARLQGASTAESARVKQLQASGGNLDSDPVLQEIRRQKAMYAPMGATQSQPDQQAPAQKAPPPAVGIPTPATRPASASMGSNPGVMLLPTLDGSQAPDSTVPTAPGATVASTPPPPDTEAPLAAPSAAPQPPAPERPPQPSKTPQQVKLDTNAETFNTAQDAMQNNPPDSLEWKSAKATLDRIQDPKVENRALELRDDAASTDWYKPGSWTSPNIDTGNTTDKKSTADYHKMSDGTLAVNPLALGPESARTFTMADGSSKTIPGWRDILKNAEGNGDISARQSEALGQHFTEMEGEAQKHVAEQAFDNNDGYLANTLSKKFPGRDFSTPEAMQQAAGDPDVMKVALDWSTTDPTAVERVQNFAGAMAQSYAIKPAADFAKEASIVSTLGSNYWSNAAIAAPTALYQYATGDNSYNPSLARAVDAIQKSDDPKNTALWKWGDSMQKGRVFQGDARKKDSADTAVADLTGSLAQFAAMTAAGGIGVGAADSALGLGLKGTVSHIGSMATGVGTGMVQTGAQMYDEGRTAGLSKEDALVVNGLGNLIGGAQGLLSPAAGQVGRAFDPAAHALMMKALADQAKKGTVREILMHAAQHLPQSMLQQGLEMGGITAAQNVAAHEWYDKDRKLLDGVAESIGMGAVGGGGMEIASGAMGLASTMLRARTLPKLYQQNNARLEAVKPQFDPVTDQAITEQVRKTPPVEGSSLTSADITDADIAPAGEAAFGWNQRTSAANAGFDARQAELSKYIAGEQAKPFVGKDAKDIVGLANANDDLAKLQGDRADMMESAIKTRTQTIQAAAALRKTGNTDTQHAGMALIKVLNGAPMETLSPDERTAITATLNPDGSPGQNSRVTMADNGQAAVSPEFYDAFLKTAPPEVRAILPATPEEFADTRERNMQSMADANRTLAHKHVQDAQAAETAKAAVAQPAKAYATAPQADSSVKSKAGGNADVKLWDVEFRFPSGRKEIQRVSAASAQEAQEKIIHHKNKYIKKYDINVTEAPQESASPSDSNASGAAEPALASETAPAPASKTKTSAKPDGVQDYDIMLVSPKGERTHVTVPAASEAEAQEAALNDKKTTRGSRVESVTAVPEEVTHTPVEGAADGNGAESAPEETKAVELVTETPPQPAVEPMPAAEPQEPVAEPTAPIKLTPDQEAVRAKNVATHLPKTKDGEVSIKDIASHMPDAPPAKVRNAVRKLVEKGEAVYSNRKAEKGEFTVSSDKGETGHIKLVEKGAPKTALNPKSVFEKYRELKKKQGGLSAVSIGELIKATGYSKEEMHKFLLHEAGKERADLHPTTLIHDSLSDADKAGSMPLPGRSEPAINVTLREPEKATPLQKTEPKTAPRPDLSTPEKARAEIRRIGAMARNEIVKELKNYTDEDARSLAKEMGLKVKEKAGVRALTENIVHYAQRHYENIAAHMDVEEKPTKERQKDLEKKGVAQPKDVLPTYDSSSNIRDAYKRLVSGGARMDIPITDLQKASGLDMQKLKDWLEKAHKRGEVQLTTGDWAADPERRSGAIQVNGSPKLLVRFLDEQHRREQSMSDEIEGKKPSKSAASALDASKAYDENLKNATSPKEEKISPEAQEHLDTMKSMVGMPKADVLSELEDMSGARRKEFAEANSIQTESARPSVVEILAKVMKKLDEGKAGLAKAPAPSAVAPVNGATPVAPHQIFKTLPNYGDYDWYKLLDYTSYKLGYDAGVPYKPDQSLKRLVPTAPDMPVSSAVRAGLLELAQRSNGDVVVRASSNYDWERFKSSEAGKHSDYTPRTASSEKLLGLVPDAPPALARAVDEARILVAKLGERLPNGFKFNITDDKNVATSGGLDYTGTHGSDVGAVFNFNTESIHSANPYKVISEEVRHIVDSVAQYSRFQKEDPSTQSYGFAAYQIWQNQLAFHNLAMTAESLRVRGRNSKADLIESSLLNSFRTYYGEDVSSLGEMQQHLESGGKYNGWMMEYIRQFAGLVSQGTITEANVKEMPFVPKFLSWMSDLVKSIKSLYSSGLLRNTVLDDHLREAQNTVNILKKALGNERVDAILPSLDLEKGQREANAYVMKRMGLPESGPTSEYGRALDESRAAAVRDANKFLEQVAQGQKPELPGLAPRIDSKEGSKITALTQKAAAEKSGEYTIGDERLALNNISPTMRATNEWLKDKTNPTAIADLDRVADSKIAADKDGNYRRALISTGQQSGMLNPVDTRAAMKMIASDSAKPMTRGHVRNMRNLIVAYRASRSEVALSLRAGVDPNMTPLERAREYLASQILEPPLKTQQDLRNATSPEERDAILKKDDARTDRLMQEFKKMRITVDDIFNGDVALTLKSNQIVQNTMNDLGMKPEFQEAFRALQDGTKSFDQVAKETGLKVSQVKETHKRMYDAIRQKLIDKVKGGAKADDVDIASKINEGKLKKNMASEADTGDTATSKDPDSELSEEHRVELDKIMRKMGIFHPDIQGKMQPVTEPGGGRAISNPRQPGAKPREPKGPRTPKVRRIDITDPNAQAELARTAHAAEGHNYLDLAMEASLHNLLSGPVTQVKNITGNAINIAWEHTMMRGIQAMFNDAYGLAAGSKFDPAGPSLGGMSYIKDAVHTGIAKGFTEMLRSYKYNKDFFSDEVGKEPGEVGKAFKENALPQINSINPIPQKKSDGTMESVREAAVRAGGVPLAAATRVLMPLNRAVGGRALVAADSFFKYMAGHMEATFQAYRMSKKAWDDKTLTPIMKEDGTKETKAEAIARSVNTMVGMYDSPAWKAAADHATEITGQKKIVKGKNPFDNVVYGVLEARRNSRILQMMMPFVKTPYNFEKMGLRKSPLGTLGAGVRLGYSMYDRIANGKPIVDNYSRADMLRDTTEQLVAWGVTAFLMGAVKSVEGDEDDQDKQWLITGSRPSTLSVGNQQERVSGGSYTIKTPWGTILYGGIEPLGATSLGTIVDFVKSYKQMKNGKAEAAALDSFVGYMKDQVKSKTVLKSISDAMDIWAQQTNSEEGNVSMKGVKNMLTQFVAARVVPNAIRQPLRALDPYVRNGKTAGILYNALPYSPYLDSPNSAFGAEPAVDAMTGGPVMKGGNAATRMLSPSPVMRRPEPVEPLDKLLYRWNQISSSQWAPPPPQNTYMDRVTGQEKTMTSEETKDYEEAVSALWKRKLSGYITPSRIERPTQSDIFKIKETLNQAKTEVQGRMFGKIPVSFKARSPYDQLSE